MSTQLLTNPTAKPPEPPPPDPPRITEEEAALQKADARIKALEDEVAALKAEAKARSKPEVINESVNETPNAKEPAKQSAWQTFEASAYTVGKESTGKSKGDRGYGITASGASVVEGVTVACPPSMSLGSVIEIKGVGERVCQDRGSAITEGHLDIYMESDRDAVNFGRKLVQARLVEEG
ncbi:3D domain-containing protein [Bacillus velezensis]|uniref:3D domain-containing protein n=1 Tax=Bacillus velezensis TaxID=492670 RepID=UPI0013750129|nr:3D domain-containing protein [Bacillus velezensis]WED89367.1 3D domain-containing protein [Bacillus velezensis]WFB52455.1 3D domain-containing protein [Bacillus velezensis]